MGVSKPLKHLNVISFEKKVKPYIADTSSKIHPLRHILDCSQHPLIRTLKGPKICSNKRMFRLLKVVIKTIVVYQNGRKTEISAFLHSFQRAPFLQYTTEGDRLYAFLYI